MKRRSFFNNLILAFGILCILYYIGMGLAVRFGQSLLWLWPLIGAVCIIRWLLVRRSIKTGEPVKLPVWFIRLWRICLCAGLAFFCFVEFFIVRGSFEKAPDDLDCIIVLGARVNGDVPSGALRQRIDAAADYLGRSPGTVCIVSGGQGDDELMSEAACMLRELTALGIDSGRIIIEDKSTDTFSNLENSLALVPESTRSIGVLTNDFHVFRALNTARMMGGYSFSGVPARSTVYGYVHYAVREFCAVVVSVLEGSLSF